MAENLSGELTNYFMKKLVIMIAFNLFLFIISTVSAAEIQLSRERYSPSETLQAEIYGNFIDGLQVENIYFYRERNIPMIYDILKTKDKYLLYALLPSKEGNYTLNIKDTRYETDIGTSTADIIKKFQIRETNETSLSINPGFVVARDDFDIKVKANKNIDIESEFEATGETQNISLAQNKEKKIYFSVSDIKNYTETNIKVQNYNLPIFIFPEKSEAETKIREAPKFRFNPAQLEAVILKKEISFFKVYLINLGRVNISSIELSSDIPKAGLEIELSPDSIPELEPGERRFINLTVLSEKKGNFSGSIVALSEDNNLSAELKLNFEITEDKTEVSYEGPSYTEEENCEDIGELCKITEKCDGVSIFTKDGYCCQGSCIEEKESSSWIYGLIIIIAIIIGLILLSFYMKKKQKRAINIIEQRGKKYEERMSGRTKGEEVSGKLAKT